LPKHVHFETKLSLSADVGLHWFLHLGV